MQNKTILLISPEPWGINFVSKHHYSNYLSKENKVYFLNPPSGFSKNLFKGIQCKTEKITESLTVVNYLNLLPRLNELPKIITSNIYQKQAKAIQKEIGIDHFDIVWSFDPNRFFDQAVWKTEKTLYHTVDVHQNKLFEDKIINSSDVVLSLSESILSKKVDKKIDIIGHGFNQPDDNIMQKVIPGNNALKAVYLGNVSNLLDLKRLKTLSIKFPKIDFIIIGPYRNSNLSHAGLNIELDAIKKLPNVYLIGEIPADEIQPYLRSCQINLFIIKHRENIPLINSHKLMDYFYTGNITLADELLDYKGFDRDIMIQTNTSIDYIKELEIIVKNLSSLNSEELKKKRRTYAIANTYAHKILAIEKLLNNISRNCHKD